MSRRPDRPGAAAARRRRVDADGRLAIGGVDLVGAGRRVRHAAVRVRRGRAARPLPRVSRRASAPTRSRTRARRSSASRWRASWPRKASHLDVATGGELHVALHAGFPAERIVFHGNNKSAAELRAALDAGVGRIVVDSFDELDRLEAAGRRRRAAPPCSCGSRPASKRTRTSTSRPAPTTRSSGSRSSTRRRPRAAVRASSKCDAMQLRRPPLPHRLADPPCSTRSRAAADDRRPGSPPTSNARPARPIDEINLGGGLGVRVHRRRPRRAVASRECVGTRRPCQRAGAAPAFARRAAAHGRAGPLDRGAGRAHALHRRHDQGDPGRAHLRRGRRRA